MTENQNPSRDNRTEYLQDTVMEHEYDGIQEFDNRLPPAPLPAELGGCLPCWMDSTGGERKAERALGPTCQPQFKARDPRA